MDVLENLDQVVSVKHRVREFIVENMLLGEDNGFENDASLLEAGILDSTGVMELVAFLEDNLCITVKDEEITPENFDSVDLICAFLARKQSVAARSAGITGALTQARC
jgi:acyl carrier protein